MTDRLKRNVLLAVILFFCIFFIVRFGGLAILKLYIESGMGDCQKIPILCIKPQSEIINPPLDEAYLFGLPYCELTEVQICTPKEFKVVKQMLKKIYPGTEKSKTKESVIYLLYEKPGFFVRLFPQLKKQGINTDYEFIRRMLFANLNDIKSLADAFFVIIKGIFTPDLGEQYNVKMVGFKTEKFRGFISYNLGFKENYFDCNVFDKEDNFFKIYIKDFGKILDLDKVFLIISTLKKV